MCPTLRQFGQVNLAVILKTNGRFVFGPPALERTTKVDDAQGREILKQIDEITKQICERHHEETRQQIDELYKEVYRRIKELRADDVGKGKS